MKERLQAHVAAPKTYQVLMGVYRHLRSCGIEHELLDLLDLRASQINGCAYCTDMHWKDLRAAGVPEQKLSMLTVWREFSGFTERERAGLEWCEAVTLVTQGHVPDEVFRIAREQFSEEELVNLTLSISAINTWNRLAIAFRKEAGGYQPGSIQAK